VQLQPLNHCFLSRFSHPTERPLYCAWAEEWQHQYNTHRDVLRVQNLVPQREENLIYRTELYFKPKIINPNFSFWDYFQIIHLSCWPIFIKGGFSSINDSVYFVFFSIEAARLNITLLFWLNIFSVRNHSTGFLLSLKYKGWLGRDDCVLYRGMRATNSWLCFIFVLGRYDLDFALPIPVFLSLIGFLKQWNSRWNVSSCTV
jgi:hypothetical protein